MDLNDKTVREICSCAQIRRLRTGEAIFCEDANGKDAPQGIQFVNLNKGEVCLATTYYLTGHPTMDSCVCLEEMERCQYRKKN